VVCPAPSVAENVAVCVPGVLVSKVDGPVHVCRLEPPRSVHSRSVATVAPST
jgi:hypothetical protein